MDRLDVLYLAQLELIHNICSVYSSNGFDAWTRAPQLDDRIHQVHIKYVAWCLVEELVEARDAPGERQHEEIVDAFHFLLELVIFCDMTPEDLFVWTMNSIGVPGVPTLDRLDYMFFAAGTHHCADGLTALERVTVALGRAMYQLKQKPWRVTDKPTNTTDLRRSIGALFHGFILFAMTSGMTAKQLQTEYFNKNKVNHTRVQEKY